MGRRRLTAISALVLAFVAPACAASAPSSTTPTAAVAVEAAPPSEARFDLKTGDRVSGTASVKSSGPYVADVDGQQRVVIVVTIQIDNIDGAREIAIDPADLRLTVEGTSARVDELPPAGSSGRTTAPPKASTTLRAHFTLPADVSVGQVQRYAVAWALRDGDTIAYQLKTPFVGGPSGAVYVAAPPPDVAPTVYYAPYGYWYGGVWYDAHAHPYAHHDAIVIVPHAGVHGSVHGWGYSSPVHHGGVHYGGGHGGAHGGGHHGGGHH